jgi:hypothetical protein
LEGMDSLEISNAVLHSSSDLALMLKKSTWLIKNHSLD